MPDPAYTGVMAALLFALNPFLVSGLTSLIKRIPAISNLSDGKFTVIVRLIAATLSLLGAIGVYLQTGTLDQDQVAFFINVFIDTILNFTAATGIHFLGKKK